MYKDLFQSINESIKKRNNPEDFLPTNYEGKDIIHRGYINNAAYPIRYSFMPDDKGGSNSGLHIYHFKDKNINGVVEIHHKYSPNVSGHETRSVVSFENLGKDKLDSIDLHRMMLPIISHHVRSHDPDVIHFKNNIKYGKDIIRRLGSSYQTNDNKIAKKVIDPKMKRILSHVKNKLNRNKEK